MIIPVYWGTRSSSAITQAVIKRVTCEKCGCVFAYEMVRRVVGSDRGAYSLDQQAGKARATYRAQAAIQSALYHHEDPVACPTCGWFQQAMVAKNSRRFWFWTPWGKGVGIDPNRDYPNNRGHFPGTPEAVRLAPDPPQTIPTNAPPEIEPGDILSIRLAQDTFPPVCCNCLKDADAVAVARRTRGVVPGVNVPLCKKCQQDMNKARGRFILKILLLPAASLFLLLFVTMLVILLCIIFFSPPPAPSFDRADLGGFLEILKSVLGMAICLGVASCFIGLIISGLIWISKGEHYFTAARVISVDPTVLTCRIHFPNAAFRALLCQHISNSPIPKSLQALLTGPHAPPIVASPPAN